MSRIEKEFQEFDNNRLWAEVYQKVKNEASIQSITDEYSVGEARKPENRSKNRYRDVSPYDHSRVVLQEGDADYIHASLIEVPKSKRKYILTQGPLETTTGQFWQMIWEQDCRAIIMLNRVMEKGAVKCYQYWPLGEHLGHADEVVTENIKVTILEEQKQNHYIVRTMELEERKTGKTREIYHFQYVTWPDFGVPSSPIAFLNFLMAVRETGVLEQDVGPCAIHCSAGIGRSGTFCLVDSCLIMIEEAKTLDCVDIRSELLAMRSYRMGLIQTPDQLRFSYQAIIEGGRHLLGKDAATTVDNVVEAYMDMSGKEDVPPAPPTRTTSLSPSKRKESPPPPPPHRQSSLEKTGDKLTENGEPPDKQAKLESEESDDDVEVIEDEEEEDWEVPPKPLGREPLPKAGSEQVQGEPRDQDIDHNPGEGRLQEGEEEEAQDIPAGHLAQANSVGHTPGDHGESETELRRRRREERKKNTQEIIKQMKDKQRTSERWRKRRSYFKPIAIGLTILIGGLLLYKFYW